MRKSCMGCTISGFLIGLIVIAGQANAQVNIDTAVFGPFPDQYGFTNGPHNASFSYKFRHNNQNYAGSITPAAGSYPAGHYTCWMDTDINYDNDQIPPYHKAHAHTRNVGAGAFFWNSKAFDHCDLRDTNPYSTAHLSVFFPFTHSGISVDQNKVNEYWFFTYGITSAADKTAHKLADASFAYNQHGYVDAMGLFYPVNGDDLNDLYGGVYSPFLPGSTPHYETSIATTVTANALVIDEDGGNTYTQGVQRTRNGNHCNENQNVWTYCPANVRLAVPSAKIFDFPEGPPPGSPPAPLPTDPEYGLEVNWGGMFWMGPAWEHKALFGPLDRTPNPDIIYFSDWLEYLKPQPNNPPSPLYDAWFTFKPGSGPVLTHMYFYGLYEGDYVPTSNVQPARVARHICTIDGQDGDDLRNIWLATYCGTPYN